VIPCQNYLDMNDVKQGGQNDTDDATLGAATSSLAKSWRTEPSSWKSASHLVNLTRRNTSPGALMGQRS
jgi:hypothetical protein